MFSHSLNWPLHFITPASVGKRKTLEKTGILPRYIQYDERTAENLYYFILNRNPNLKTIEIAVKSYILIKKFYKLFA